MKKSIIVTLVILGAAVSGLAQADNENSRPAPVNPSSPVARAAFERATALAQQKDQPPAAIIAAFAEAIEAEPDFLPAHEALVKFGARLKNQGLGEKYAEWEKRFPNSLGVSFGIGLRYYEEEDPRAKPYLLKVVAREPATARVWAMLSFDADRWGDKPGAAGYMLKASQAEPDNADYAFYSANELRESHPVKWEEASLEVARRFPTSDRGAQALYWLGAKTVNEAKRIAFWEQARAAFPPGKFWWTGNSMSGLFDAYLHATPDRAITLARDMAATLEGENVKGWVDRMNFAKCYQAVRTLADLGNFNEALLMLDKLPAERRSSNPGPTLLLKAEILAGAGKVQAAYDSVMQRFASLPEDDLRAVLLRYGASLGKNAAQIATDVWAARDAAAKPAPDFDLGLYTSDQKVSLASLRGKVVFVTFWFPGCGPCRAEFPHFENVVTKFKGNQDLVYLGINGIRQQDAYVASFMEGTNYSFTPLKGEKSVTAAAPEGYDVKYYPENFLIDRDGRIIFSNFRAHDPESELVLQRMIEALLARPTKA